MAKNNPIRDKIVASQKAKAKSKAVTAAQRHEAAKTGRKPTEAQRAAAKARRAGDAAGAAACLLGPFELEFCLQYAHTGLLAPSYLAAEVRTNTPLDLSNYEIATEREVTHDNKLKRITRRIYTLEGEHVKEEDIRYARAMALMGYPEVRDRIAQIKAERAARIKVSAESIAEELDAIAAHAMTVGQLQVAAATKGMKAKMFGIEAGTGEAPAAPVTEVRINIRDCTKAKEA
jgi:hypothetical protein